MKWSKRVIVFLLLCFILISLLIIVSFVQYRTQLDEEFDQLIEENLTAYAEGQRTEIQGMIVDIKGTLEAIAVMVDSTEIDPEGPWLANYLRAIGEKQARYQVTYASLSELFSGLNDSGVRPEDWQTYDLLSRGKSVVSNVRFSKRMGEKYYFSIAVPVYKNGEVAGVLRSLVQAEKLVQTLQTGYFRESVQSYLVKGNGDFVEISEPLPNNLYTAMRPYLTEQEDQDSVREMLKQNQNTTCKFQLEDQSYIYISTVSLGYNDWHIVNITSAENVSRHSKVIMQYTVEMGVFLILLTIAAGLAFFWTVQRQKKKLHLEHERYAVLAKFSDTVLFQYFYKDQIWEFTSNAQKLLPLSSLRICGGNESSVEILHPDDRKRVAWQLENPLPEGEICSQELRMMGLNNTYFWCLCQYQTFYDKKKRPLLAMGKLVDINSQKERELILLEKSERDSLTGLYNKATVENQIRLYLRKERSRGFLYMIDIDNFKQVNDRRGHAEGDRLLARIGTVLCSVFREESDILGRAGGDEFVAFMTGSDDQSVATDRAQRILEKIRALSDLWEGSCPVSCSIGIAAWPGDYTEYEDLFRAADHAMYHAKKEGKNTFSF
ncbi:diguanylate cyclase [Clostridium sp. D33t1_170424_F3]|uniref:diguanylate cyclase domain-containing protein n=1 Tax=Clostridium sp. D33t1_170424_F3 TaxID=2787099 RepID=UPI0018A95D3D|nr:diguanylate cyclase [Clostridium sp. D33t1_170424_F3]